MALCLTRKISEALRIGEDIVVQVRGVSGNRVKLSIDAPRSVRIRRTELPDVQHDEQPLAGRGKRKPAA